MDVADLLCALHANDVGVRIGRVVAAPGSPVDQQGLWRVEPQPDEWDRGSPGSLFNDPPACRPRIDRIDDDAAADYSAAPRKIAQRSARLEASAIRGAVMLLITVMVRSMLLHLQGARGPLPCGPDGSGS